MFCGVCWAAITGVCVQRGESYINIEISRQINTERACDCVGNNEIVMTIQDIKI